MLHAGGIVALRLHCLAVELVAHRHPVGVEAFLQRCSEHGVTMVVEIEHTLGQSIARRRQRLRRPAQHRRGAADHQRRRRTDRQPAGLCHPLAAWQICKRPVEPAGGGVAGAGETAFQYVLAVEMRAVAIAGRGGMHHRRLARLEQAREHRHRRVEREETVERQRRVWP